MHKYGTFFDFIHYLYKIYAFLMENYMLKIPFQFLILYSIIQIAVTQGNRYGGMFIMISKEVTISTKTDLESKMAARLIQKASSYESNIWVQKGERKANAKSLLGLLSLGISPGDTITIITDGSDETTALAELEVFANNGMTE